MLYKAIIIGGGPAGLYMANLLEEYNYPYLLLESFYQLGGQCINVYPNKYMYDIPGLGAITGYMFTQLLLKKINLGNIKLQETYINYEKKEDIFIVKTNNNIYTCRNLIIASGVGECIFNKPQLPYVDKYIQKQIFYFPKDPSLYMNKNIIIFGGGDTALDAVECLYKNNNVILVHRRDIFTAMAQKLHILNYIKIYLSYNLISLNEDNHILNTVTIKNANMELNLDCDYIFFCYGYQTSTNIPKILVSIDNMQDSQQKYLFALGSASIYHEKRDLITTNMWEARLILHNLI
jgi:thioredoxin reductase